MVVGKLWKTLSKLSLGLVLVVGWGWMFLNVEDIFPTNAVLMKGVLTTYLLFTALIFSFDTIASQKTERVLFEVSFLKESWKAGVSAIAGIVVFYLLGLLIKGSALPTIKEAVTTVGFGIVLLHLFYVATFETLVFVRRIPEELRARKINEVGVWIISTIIFASFHWALSQNIWSLLIYIPLGMLFLAVNDKWSKRTGMVAIGVHFAWNIFILGFLS